MSKPIFKIFNSLTGRVEPFKPVKPGRVGIYTCGPTVYDFAHIGNFRAYVVADILVRLMRYLGFRVRWVMNITDIDDKTLAGAEKVGLPLQKFTHRFEGAFFDDLKTLNISRSDVYPRATEHFAEMGAIISQLEKRKLAYHTQDGIYFDISNLPGYGRLAGLTKRELKPGARVKVDAYDKHSPSDFALWKFDRLSVNRQLLNVARTPDGRPGWHIECSAMSVKYLGQPFDLHTGGVDLIFPHHTNEIAQSEGAFGKPLARYFVHNEHLLVDGEKMAKSKGNFYTVRDIVKRGYDPMALRYLYFQSHYREKMNFTWAGLGAAQNAIQGIKELIQRQSEARIKKHKPPINNKSQIPNPKFQINPKFQTPNFKKIKEALTDDLNTPKALALLHEANDPWLWFEFDEVFGLGFGEAAGEFELTNDQRALLEKRERLRKIGQFEQADAIRRQLKEQGIVVEDTKEGTRVFQRSKSQVPSSKSQ